jgi:DNA-binding transcriptional MerR regulator
MAACAVVLILPATARCAGEDDTEQIIKRIAELREQVGLADFLAAMKITDKQSEDILKVLYESEAHKSDVNAKLRQQLKDIESVFVELRKALANGPNLSRDIEGRAVKNDFLEIELRKRAEDELTPYCRKIAELLTDAQKKICEKYVLNVTPMGATPQPAAEVMSQRLKDAVARLAMLRGIPKDEWETKRNEIAERHLSTFEKFGGKLSAEERSSEKRRLIELAGRVRAMSPEEFEKDKEKLAPEFAVKDKMRDLQKEMAATEDIRRPGASERRMVRNFTSAQMLPLLEQRVAKAKGVTVEDVRKELGTAKPEDNPGQK